MDVAKPSRRIGRVDQDISHDRAAQRDVTAGEVALKPRLNSTAICRESWRCGLLSWLNTTRGGANHSGRRQLFNPDADKTQSVDGENSAGIWGWKPVRRKLAYSHLMVANLGAPVGKFDGCTE